jgi:hypothetical protein
LGIADTWQQEKKQCTFFYGHHTIEILEMR